MSHLPPMLQPNWLEVLERPYRHLDQAFGLDPEQLREPQTLQQMIQHYLPPRGMMAQVPSPLPYYSSWGHGHRGTSTVNSDKTKFQVILDVQQFRPEEINVKVQDRFVVVEAKHEEKQDEHGWISRQFTRKYMIPEQCDVEQVASSLSSDGVLTITAPRKEIPKVDGEKTIKIQHTGKPAVRHATDAPCK